MNRTAILLCVAILLIMMLSPVLYTDAKSAIIPRNQTVSYQLELQLNDPFILEAEHIAPRISKAFNVNQEKALEVSGWIVDAYYLTGVEPGLLAALIQTESSYRYHVKSSVNAYGLAQVRPDYWNAICGDVKRPEVNVNCAAMILSQYEIDCGSIGCALEMYNVGPSNVKRDRLRGARHRYLSKIERYYNRYLSIDLSGDNA
ncbi:lytic transglycosylase domain-containing protein [Neptuniibacter sp. QD37_11]|uniref:lytic transglycosylase domain-containing protein n=1 Tax=Neptuniibacter sp. QD37_11 TaxID=3398209 RepID=UPI0039F576DD